MPSLKITYKGNIYNVDFERHMSYPYPYYEVIIADSELISELQGQNVFYIMETKIGYLQLPPVSVNNLDFHYILANALLSWLSCKF